MMKQNGGVHITLHMLQKKQSVVKVSHTVSVERTSAKNVNR